MCFVRGRALYFSPGLNVPYTRASSHEQRTTGTGMKRMSLRRFGQIVARVMETLPAEFRPYLDNVVVDVEEEPDEKTLRKAGFTEDVITAGETLFGLFDPLELP